MEAKEELSRLIKEFNNGNTDSFVQIMDIVKESVYKVIYAFLNNEENSIDVFDEVIYKSYINLHTLKPSGIFQNMDHSNCYK